MSHPPSSRNFLPLDLRRLQGTLSVVADNAALLVSSASHSTSNVATRLLIAGIDSCLVPFEALAVSPLEKLFHLELEFHRQLRTQAPGKRRHQQPAPQLRLPNRQRAPSPGRRHCHEPANRAAPRTVCPCMRHLRPPRRPQFAETAPRPAPARRLTHRRNAGKTWQKPPFVVI